MLIASDRKKIRELVKKGEIDARIICRANALHMRLTLNMSIIEVADCLQITAHVVFGGLVKFQ